MSKISILNLNVLLDKVVYTSCRMAGLLVLHYMYYMIFDLIPDSDMSDGI